MIKNYKKYLFFISKLTLNALFLLFGITLDDEKNKTFNVQLIFILKSTGEKQTINLKNLNIWQKRQYVMIGSIYNNLTKQV